MNIEFIESGITAPKGFLASGMHCGLRKNRSRRDLALIAAEHPCAAAGVFTTNKVFAAPVGVSRAHIANGTAQAIICNSGNANTCNADGYDKANLTCETLAKALNIAVDDVVVASTGVIGVPLPVEPILSGIPHLAATLGSDRAASQSAAAAIMTTDTRMKEFAVRYEIDGKSVHIGGICKGSGMIEPNMATMLGFVTTDAAITAAMLDKALRAAVADTFNMVSVDGDTSTNDMVVVLASGDSGADTIEAEGDAYEAFAEALAVLCRKMAMTIAADGEGATKLLACHVVNFSDEAGAKKLAKSVIKSPLVKTAMFGADANWGRVLCALGYSGVDFDPDKVSVRFISSVGEIPVCSGGRSLPFDEDTAKAILLRRHITIEADMGCGEAEATAWGCDLSYEYVRINGDYRS